MKSLKAVVTLVVCLIFALPTLASTTKSFRVEGVTCDGCRSSITKKLSAAIEGYESIKFRTVGKQEYFDLTVSTTKAPELSAIESAMKGQDYKFFETKGTK